jgi:choline dehydrogenase-like flavoprotein
MSRNYLEQDPLQQTYDAVVVGSGATGGWAAKQLAEAGLKVALLEAGRAVSPIEFTEHTPAYKLKYRDHSPEIVRTRPIQKQCYACMEYNYEWFVNDLDNPSKRPATMVMATTGLSPTPILLRFTTSWRSTWASPALQRETRCYPTGSFCRR